MTASHIMIADDSRAMRQMLKSSLQQMNPSTVFTEAENGQEVLSALEKDVYDAIFLDINMPEMDGLDCLRELRKKWHSVPVVMCTSNSQQKIVIEALSNGANSYIVKPVSVAKISKALKAVTQPELCPLCGK